MRLFHPLALAIAVVILSGCASGVQKLRKIDPSMSIVDVATSANATEVLQLPACHFSVRFPAKPTIQRLSVPAADQNVPWSSAILKSTEGVFRHECVCVRGMNVGRIDASFVKKRMTAFARANGLSNFGFKSLSFRDGVALDVHFISSLPVKQRPACMAWTDKTPVQMVWAES